MTPKTAHDFDQELLILFDAYVHGALDRRGFLDKAAKYAVGGVTAAMLLDQLSPKFVEAQVVKPEDARIKVEYLEYESPKGYGKMRGYLAQPAKAAGKLPAVLVIHENRGLNPHIEDIARRLALDNFVAFAPDALFPLGGYPGDEDKAREVFPKLDQAKTREDFIAGLAWLKARPETNGKVGAVGFCYGGGMVNFLATRVPELAAGVAFYGASPNVEDVPKIKATLVIQSAEVDERINASWPAYRSGVEGGQRALRALPLPGHAARLQQRHDAALRRHGGQARMGADGRSLQRQSSLNVRLGNSFRTRIPTCVHLCESSRPSRSACVSPLRQSGSRSGGAKPAGTASDTTARIVAAAQAVVATLDDAGRAKVQFPFEGPQKTRWSNLPVGIFQREGLRLADLTPPQRAAVNTLLLATALSKDGYRKVTEIMRGDEALRIGQSGRGGGDGRRSRRRRVAAAASSSARTSTSSPSSARHRRRRRGCCSSAATTWRST